MKIFDKYDHDPERKWAYVEPDENWEAIEVVISEQEILDFYWEFWQEQMHRVNREHLISKEACIEDFIVVNWAQLKQQNNEDSA